VKLLLFCPVVLLQYFDIFCYFVIGFPLSSSPLCKDHSLHPYMQLGIFSFTPLSPFSTPLLRQCNVMLQTKLLTICPQKLGIELIVESNSPYQANYVYTSHSAESPCAPYSHSTSPLLISASPKSDSPQQSVSVRHRTHTWPRP
jgi:hypothetical protein